MPASVVARAAGCAAAEGSGMKTPPFLLLAALAFWGWQTGELIVGLGVGVLLEATRFIPVRWELGEEDFRRVWNLCMLLALAQVVFVLAFNDESATNSFRAASATAHAATTLLRRLPVIMAVLVAAQNFSQVGMVPLAALWLPFSYRQMAGKKLINVSYPFLMICLFSAGMHENTESHSYFWGLCGLMAWAMWPWRTRRFHLAAWVLVVAAVVVLGRLGADGIWRLDQYLEGYSGQWMVRLMQHGATDPDQSQTDIGQIGQLKLSGRIVIRLRPKAGDPAPAYLREATYWHYFSQSHTRQFWSTDAPTNDFFNLPADADNEYNYTLVQHATNTSSAFIECYLNGWSSLLHVPQGLLPLPSGSHHLTQLPYLAEMAGNRYGAVRVAGQGFVMFNAESGPGATMDSPPGPGTNDFQVPTNELPALQAVAAELHAADLSEPRKLLAVEHFFADNFTYSTWQGRDKLPRTNGETALGRFLLKSRSGHCEYFATATVLLLRELHIPARYAVGYAVHELHGKDYVVRDRDAHAWCLYWDGAKKEWQDLDTTPGSWEKIEAERASMWEWLSDGFSWLKFEFATFRYGQSEWRKYLLWAIVPMILFLIYRVVFRRGRQRAKLKSRQEKAVLMDWPGLDSEFYRLEKRLTERGVPRQPAEALSDWLNRALGDPALADLRRPLLELLRLHYRYRFDPAGLDAAGREELRRRTSECLAALERTENSAAKV